MSARRRRRQRQGDVFPEERKGTGRGWTFAAVLLFVAVLALGVWFFRLAKDRLFGFHEPEYEQGAEFEDDGSPDGEAARLNVAVLPDYTVSKASPYILVPYPEENGYEAEFVFRDAHTGKTLYRTKRVRPGTVVRVEAFDFCKYGSNPMLVDVELYDPRTWDMVESAVSLETTVIKDE